jgi:hypothetical protein
VEFKYGSQWGGWCFNEVNGLYKVFLWKFIRRGWEEFLRYIRFEAGDGSKISLFRDVRCGDQSLKVAFLKLFSIVCFKNASMANHL